MQRAALPKLQSRVPRQRNRSTHTPHALAQRRSTHRSGGASAADTDVRRLQSWRRPKPSRESSRRGARRDAQALRACGVQATARTERRGRVVSGGAHLPRKQIAPRALRRRTGACPAAQLGEYCTGSRLDTKQTHARLRVGCKRHACKRAEHPAAPLACKSGCAVCCATHLALVHRHRARRLRWCCRSCAADLPQLSSPLPRQRQRPYGVRLAPAALHWRRARQVYRLCA